MFAYNPTVNDRSGEIMASGQMQAAQANADMLKGIGQDIGGAIASLAGSYVQGKQLEAKAKGYEEFLGMHGKTLFGEDGGQMIDRFSKMSPMQKAQFGDMFVGDLLKSSLQMKYLNRQAELFPKRTGIEGGAAAGAGDYVVGQGWTGQ